MHARTLITGANRGIGFALVRKLLESGRPVIAACRNPSEATDLAALAREAGDRLQVVPLHVNDSTSVETLARTLAGRGVALSLLINNAGAMEKGFGLENADRAEFDHVFQTNVTAPFFLVKALLPCLRLAAPARVVQISSILGSIGSRSPDMGFRCYAYNASKCALNMVSVMLAEELADDRIDVSLLHPGWVATAMGGEQAPLQPEESASGLLRVIDQLEAGNSGQFLDYEGNPLPW